MNNIPTQSYQMNYWLCPIIPKRELTANDVISATCIVFNVLKGDLLSPSKKEEIVRARYICMQVIRMKITISSKPISLKKIGQKFNRDHTTVLHALAWIRDELSMKHTKEQCEDEIQRVLELLK